MTREADLTRIARRLDRMVSEDNTEGALAVLRELKDFDMTLKLLQETRVGMSVNSLRKHCCDAEVIALAKILIKDWKRLLEPTRSQAEEPEDGNGLGSGQVGGSPSPSEIHSSPEMDPRPEQNPPQNPRGDPQVHSPDPREPSGRQVTGAPPLEYGPNGDHLPGPGKTHGRALPGAVVPPAPEGRRRDGKQEPRRGRHRDEYEDGERKRRRKRLEVEPEERRKDPEKYRSHDATRREENAGNGRPGGERWPHSLPREPPRGRRLPEQRPLFERRGVMDSSVLYPTRVPSPPRIHLPPRPPRPPRPPQAPLRPPKRPPVDAKPDAKPDRKRKRSIDPSPRPTCPAPPPPASPARRPSLEVKKERHAPPDPKAPIAPLPFHLHPPPARRKPPDPNAPFSPLPFHLHPPPLAKRPPADRKKPAPEIKTDPSDALAPSLKGSPDRLKRDRKDLTEGKEARKPSLDARKERKDSTDLKAPPQKRPALDVKKEKNRRDSSDSKPGLPVPLPTMESKPVRKDVLDSAPSLPVKRLSTDSKSDRKDSCDSKAGLPVKRLSMESKPERKDSCDSKAGLPVKRLSMDSKPDRKGSCDSRAGLPVKRLSMDSKSERKESSDCKPGLPVRRLSMDSRSDRKEPFESKKASPPLAKKLGGERRESHGAKPLNPVRKPSADGPDRRAKGNIPPLTPPSPSSSLSPGFSPSGGPLSPRLATGDTVRDKCIEMLSAALRTDNDFMEFGANCEQMAVDIEDHIYQEIRATDMKYKNRVRSRISNLKDPKNPGLRRNVLAGYIEMTRIASMSAEEMASDELKQLRNVLTQEAIREHQMAKTGGTSTDLLQCGKCRKKNCTYNQVQTRSADEPMTTFVLCNECGNRWKFC